MFGIKKKTGGNQLSQPNPDPTTDYLVKFISGLVPSGEPDKMLFLRGLIENVNNILYGDPITAPKSVSKSTEAAIAQMAQIAQKNSIGDFNARRSALTSEIKDLEGQIVQLQSVITGLETKKTQLVEDVSHLNSQLSQRNKLEEELQGLEDTLRKYNEQFDSQPVVVYRRLEEGDPLYSVSRNTIDSFISKLETEFISNAGRSQSERAIFDAKMMPIYSIREILYQYSGADFLSQASDPISAIIVSNKYGVKDTKNALLSTLNSVYVPVYPKSDLNIIATPLPEGPENQAALANVQARFIQLCTLYRKLNPEFDPNTLYIQEDPIERPDKKL